MALVTGEDFTKAVLKRWEDIPDPRLREVMQSAIKHLHAFVSEVRAERRGMVQGDRVPHRDRPQVRRQAPGVHPRFRHAGRQHAGRRHQQPARRRRDARARSKARSTFRMRRKSPTAATWRRARPAFRASSPARCAGLDGEPVAGAMLDLWQTDGEGLYEEQRRTAEPWMRGIYHTQAGRLVLRSAPSRRSATPSRWTARSATFFSRTNMSHMRPAHIHFAISAPGYHGW